MKHSFGRVFRTILVINNSFASETFAIQRPSGDTESNLAPWEVKEWGSVTRFALSECFAPEDNDSEKSFVWETVETKMKPPDEGIETEVILSSP